MLQKQVEHYGRYEYLKWFMLVMMLGCIFIGCEGSLINYGIPTLCIDLLALIILILQAFAGIQMIHVGGLGERRSIIDSYAMYKLSEHKDK